MRLRYVVAIGAILVIGLGARVVTSSVSRAHANLDARTNDSMNVLQMHRDYPNMKNVPLQKVHDMTFIFPGD
jgi:hypothetical protein